MACLLVLGIFWTGGSEDRLARGKTVNGTQSPQQWRTIDSSSMAERAQGKKTGKGIVMKHIRD